MNLFSSLPSYSVVLWLYFCTLTTAHFKVTYPYWRGDSFSTQWNYPCGGVNETILESNRTQWPLSGGAIAFTPGHPWAQTFINMGLGTNVTRFNITLIEGFNQTGNGTFCNPSVQPPAGFNIKAGDKATLQVIQIGHSGSALYNCADIVFSNDAPKPSQDVCFNTTGIGAAPLGEGATVTSPPQVSESNVQTNDASSRILHSPPTMILLGAVAVAVLLM